MIKRESNITMKFTRDELSAIKKIAETDCEDISCTECECAYASTFRACFKGECEALLRQLDVNERL